MLSRSLSLGLSFMRPATRQLVVPWYILQVTFWDIHHAGSAIILAVPCPTTYFLGVQRPLKHLHHVLSNIGHKLPTMKGATGCNVEPIALWMRTDDEVLIRCHRVPRLRSASITWELVEAIYTSTFDSFQARCPLPPCHTCASSPYGFPASIHLELPGSTCFDQRGLGEQRCPGSIPYGGQC
jgi:hypothetical protein